MFVSGDGQHESKHTEVSYFLRRSKALIQQQNPLRGQRRGVKGKANTAAQHFDSCPQCSKTQKLIAVCTEFTGEQVKMISWGRFCIQTKLLSGNRKKATQKEKRKRETMMVSFLCCVNTPDGRNRYEGASIWQGRTHKHKTCIHIWVSNSANWTLCLNGYVTTTVQKRKLQLLGIYYWMKNTENKLILSQNIRELVLVDNLFVECLIHVD